MRMKKKTAVLFAAFCFFASFTVSAQYDLRPWQTGDLTWNDFRVVDTNTVKEHSYIEFYINQSGIGSNFQDNGTTFF